MTPGSGPGAAVADGVAVLIGDRYAPCCRWVLRGGAGQVAGQPRVDGPDAGDLSGALVQVEQCHQRDGQGHLPGEPGRTSAAGRASGRSRRAILAGPGVFAEHQVEEGAGAHLVHPAIEPGFAQLAGPPADPLIGGQHLVGG